MVGSLQRSKKVERSHSRRGMEGSGSRSDFLERWFASFEYGEEVLLYSVEPAQ